MKTIFKSRLHTEKQIMMCAWRKSISDVEFNAKGYFSFDLTVVFDEYCDPGHISSMPDRGPVKSSRY